MNQSFSMRPIARIHSDFTTKFGVPRQSGLVDSLEAAADWVKQNAREGDLVITLGCGDIYKASKMMVADNNK